MPRLKTIPVLTVLALAGLSAPLGASAASATTVRTGSLSLTPARATAGDTADVFTFTYTSPTKPTPGTITIGVPAGFSAPQIRNAVGPGALSVSSSCARFQVTGVSPGPAGSSVISIAENCAAGLKGTLIYAQVAVPTAAASYSFATAYTPSGSDTATPFANQHEVAVKPGALASVTVTPATATIVPGGSQSYTVTGSDAFGNSLGTIASPKLTIKPNGSCTGTTCTATAPGAHTVTATSKKISGTATLTVAAPVQADLAVTETASDASPFYYTAETFTTTVKNTSASTQSDGVSVSATVPAGLLNATETPSQGSYDANTGTWTVGSLAAGASATLTFTGDAGDVSLGSQTVTGTASATTADPNSANNTASASEASQPAHLGVAITPDPGNPPVIDVSLPGSASWTGSAVNAENPAAPAPPVSTQWVCETASLNPCPDTAALVNPNVPTLSFVMSQLGVDSYTITFVASPASGNYTGTQQTFISFTTTNSGGG